MAGAPLNASGRRRRLAFGLAVALLGFAALEAFSCAALRVVEGRWVTLHDLAAVRARRASGDRQADLAQDPGRHGERIRDAHVLHPFLGYVMDPALVGRSAAKLGIDRLSLELGFPRNKSSVLQKPDPRRVVVGIFGGSVADIFSVSGAAKLREKLAAQEGFRGREIVLLSVAAPGYKQPQQLMALNYLLALGAHFDWVVNIDGVNDVALPPQELIPLAVAPFYPRGWYARAAELEPALRLRLGRAALLDEWRRRNAALASAPLLRWSFSAGLMWTLLDRALGARLGAAESALVAERPVGHDDQAQGPRLPAFAGSDVFEPIAALWARSSLQMHHLCRGLGVRYLHVLQPNQYLPGSKPMDDAERRAAWREDSPFRAPIETAYPLLRGAGVGLAAAGVDFLDATQLFAGMHQAAYLDDCCHLDPHGNEVLAEAIAAAMDGARPGAR